MKYCNKCEKDINTNGNFCPNCGTNLLEKKLELNENDRKKFKLLKFFNNIVFIQELLVAMLFIACFLYIVGNMLGLFGDTVDGSGLIILAFPVLILIFLVICSLLILNRYSFKSLNFKNLKNMCIVEICCGVFLSVYGILLAILSGVKLYLLSKLSDKWNSLNENNNVNSSENKDIKTNVLFVLSMILFSIVIITLGMILISYFVNSEASISDLPWILMLLALPILVISLIFSIITIIIYFKNKTVNNDIKTKKTILLIVNIVQILLLLICFISFIFIPMSDGNQTEIDPDDVPGEVEPDDEKELVCDYNAKIKESNYDDLIGSYDKSYHLDFDSKCEELNIYIDDSIKLIFNRNDVMDHNILVENYNVDIYINNALINTDLFKYSSENDSYVHIQSSSFTVYEFNDLYFFTNFRAQQCGGANTLITDKSGNVLMTINDFTYTLNDDSTFTVHNFGDCFDISDDKEITYKIDGKISVVNNINYMSRYTAKTREDFVNYLNNVNVSESTQIEVVYGNLLFIIKNNYIGNDYLLYSNLYNQVEYHDLHDNEYFTDKRKFYFIGDNGIVMVTEIGPVGSTSRFLITIFDLDSNILLTKEVITSSIDDIVVSGEYISYSSETEMQEGMNLDIKAQNDKSFCSYLDKNYKDDYVVNGTYKYKYSSDKMLLEEKKETTILDYKKKNNCK